MIQWLVGGWPTPLKHMTVSWDDDIPNVCKIKFMFQTTNQQEMYSRNVYPSAVVDPVKPWSPRWYIRCLQNPINEILWNTPWNPMKYPMKSHEILINPMKPHEIAWSPIFNHIHRWLSPPNPTTSTGPSLLRSLGIVSRTSSSAVPETSWGTKDWGNPWWILSGLR